MVLPDASIGYTGALNPSTANLNHAADVYVLIFVMRNGLGPIPNSVTVGGANATWEVTEGMYSAWSVYRAPAGLEAVVVTWPLAVAHGWIASSLTNTATDLPIIDATAQNTVFGVGITCNVPAGTPGRMIVAGVGEQGGNPITPNAGQTEIFEQDGLWENEDSWINADGLTVVGVTAPPACTLRIIALGIRDITDDLLWKRRRRHWYE